jgi:hypothetical protein
MATPHLRALTRAPYNSASSHLVAEHEPNGATYQLLFSDNLLRRACQQAPELKCVTVSTGAKLLHSVFRVGQLSGCSSEWQIEMRWAGLTSAPLAGKG